VIRGEVSNATGLVIIRRLDRSASLTKTFADRAGEAAEQILKDRAPTPAELEQVGELIATRALVMLFSPIKMPSKGAIRDVADVAGRECAEEVIRGR